MRHFSPILKPLSALLILGGIGFGIRHVASYLTAENEIRLDQQVVELDEQPLAGTLLNVPLRFVNDSDAEITLLDFRKSCSCTNIVTEGNRPLSGNRKVAPGESLSLTATINTTSRFGRQKFFVEARWKRDGKEFSQHSEINVEIRGGWKTGSDEILLTGLKPDEQFSFHVPLYDGLPDPGLILKEIRSSHPEKFQAQWTRLPESSNAPNSMSPFHKRYDLEIFGKGPARHGEFFQGQLTFLSGDDPPVQLVVPVKGKTIPSPYEALPDKLTLDFNSPDKNELTRKLLIRLHQPPEQSLRLLKHPEYTTLTPLKVSSNLLEWEVAVRFPNRTDQSIADEIVFGTSDGDPDRVTIPVTIIGRGALNEAQSTENATTGEPPSRHLSGGSDDDETQNR